MGTMTQVPIGDVPKTKNDSERQATALDRYEQVVTLRTVYPCMLLQEIGDKVGLTRERVRQLLKNEGLPTRHHDQRQQYECLQCHTVYPHHRTYGDRQGFCSRACRAAYRQIPMVCEECGVVFLRRQSDVINAAKHGQQHIFCGRLCHGAWFGRNFGWATRPEDMKKGHRRKRKYNYDRIVAMRAAGKRPREIAKELGITSPRAVSQVLSGVKRAQKGRYGDGQGC